MIMDDKIVQEQLANTGKRLDYVYGNNYSLDMKPEMITLRLPRTVANLEVIA